MRAGRVGDSTQRRGWVDRVAWVDWIIRAGSPRRVSHRPPTLPNKPHTHTHTLTGTTRGATTPCTRPCPTCPSWAGPSIRYVRVLYVCASYVSEPRWRHGDVGCHRIGRRSESSRSVQIVDRWVSSAIRIPVHAHTYRWRAAHARCRTGRRSRWGTAFTLSACTPLGTYARTYVHVVEGGVSRKPHP